LHVFEKFFGDEERALYFCPNARQSPRCAVAEVEAFVIQEVPFCFPRLITSGKIPNMATTEAEDESPEKISIEATYSQGGGT
jgi:hypothetical protein